MTEMRICICDSDAEFVQAFTSYLMEKIHDVSFYIFTSEKAFLDSNLTYQIGILSKDFLSVLEFSGLDMVEEKFYLCDDDIAKEYQHLPMVYKYQSMEIVEEMLLQWQRKKEVGNWMKQKMQKTKVVGIYSPISHELQLPFSLAVCQVLRERGRVLFLDLEEISVFEDMTRQIAGKNLMDMFFMMKQNEEHNVDISEYIKSFMGVDYIPSFHNPEEFNEVTATTWQQLFSYTMGLGYDYIVVLFGRTMQGFSEYLSCCEDLFLLNKPGDFYQHSYEHFMKYLKDNQVSSEIEPVYLPMSASNLVDGTYALEELIQGNLGTFVRKQMRTKVMIE